jgi:hypothetical protein
MAEIQLTRLQLHEACEGLGMRIEHMLANRRDYDQEQIDSARSALEVLTEAAFRDRNTRR